MWDSLRSKKKILLISKFSTKKLEQDKKLDDKPYSINIGEAS